MKKFIRILTLIMALLMMIPALLSCANQSEAEEITTASSDRTGAEEISTSEPDRFADYTAAKGYTFRISTSTNVASRGMGNSNFMIEGEGEMGHGLVSDAVFERNLTVEEKLGIKFEFYEVDQPYTAVENEVKNFIKSGDDKYDLIINDLFPIAGLTIENNFINTQSDEYENYFDFTQKYWYKDYMTDLTVINGYQYMLAGDFFADVLRSAHCLIYNKEMYNDIFHNPDEPYELVENYEWTQEKFYQIIDQCYKSLDGTNSHSRDDRYGLIICDQWGGMIPMITSGGCNYITRDEDGLPEVSIYGDKNNNRTLSLVENIYNIMYSEGTSSSNFTDSELIPTFLNKQSLFVGYQRLGSLENLANRPFEIAIVPYPMLFATDKHYTTSSHDTTEIGVIPTTAFEHASLISAVVEVLCRETSNIVIPEYYETSLKVRYADDTHAATMIDIIHDGFGNTFQLAYDAMLGDCYKSVIYETINKKSNTVASSAATKMRAAQKKLTSKIKLFKKNHKIS